MYVAGTPVQESLIGFGRRLREARRAHGFSGAELAAKLGLERSAVAHYEAGRAFPSIGVLKKLTRTLGVTIDALVFDEYESAGAIHDKELAEYFTKVDSLEPQQRALIKMFLDNMLVRQQLDDIKHEARRKKQAA